MKKKHKSIKLLPVKPFQETLDGGYCGPASLKMILEYLGESCTEKKIAKLCNRSFELGTKDADLVRVAKSYGFKAAIKNNANFTDIKQWLNKDIPVIVNWFTRGRPDYGDSEVPDGHYSVVVGIDEKYIYLQDPEIGKLRKIKRNDFLRVWFDFTGRYIKANQLIVRQIIAVYKK
ncbi:MAG: hypothetical protein COU10_01665 [Candidatus Harrisonbacteria bacterium CG10_big_fil_rev_8_21_14_0_10_45_28]|uniref:Peptidase C39 domain-containing protein n=1 Tax=Candidatus Harrisonbacteria bacterium CG10_big_fil_rev_8_21_14_0_10_45_28 TaxID=1974586 RepID=A0A2H0UNJ6_9BACT|nr:MAG: hypothetical protein COU10_01665 [Candidatus Harrisonbacteria bacterium CG10_big_fil_rev_8_21_14_0_10_45_28]